MVVVFLYRQKRQCQLLLAKEEMGWCPMSTTMGMSSLSKRFVVVVVCWSPCVLLTY